MFKKLSLKAWVIIIFCAVLLIGAMLACVITATVKDENRLVYELNSDLRSYSVVDVKNAYRGGWFAKETLTVPATHKGKPVTAIKRIRNLQKTKTVILPDGLEEIGVSAFVGSGITSIKIPDTVTKIENNAFENCTKLAEVTLPSNITSIPGAAFRSCFSLAEISIPNTVTTIGDGAFANCYSLESITFSSNLTSIGATAFSTCTGLTSVELPSRLNSIGDKAFEKCYSLIEICNNSRLNIYEGSTSNGQIAENALHVYSGNEVSYLTRTEGGTVFYSDENNIYLVKHYGKESKLTLPTFDGKEYKIRDYAFYSNSTVEEIVIPDNVTEIGWNAFDSCSALSKVTIGNGVTSIKGEAFKSCKKLTEVSFGNSIEEIGYRAFYECQRLEEIQLKDGVATIGRQAFSECDQLKNVTIGKGLQVIDDEAFFNCVRFTELKFGGTKAEWEAVELGNQWTWDNNSNKRAPSCEKVICTDGTVNVTAA